MTIAVDLGRKATKPTNQPDPEAAPKMEHVDTRDEPACNHCQPGSI